MLEIMIITGLIIGLWGLKKSLGWLIGKIVLPAQFRGGAVRLMNAIPQTGLSQNIVYVSKGHYKVLVNGQEIQGSLEDLSDIPDILRAKEIKQLKTYLKNVDKNFYKTEFADLVFKITVARHQTPFIRSKNVHIPGEFKVPLKGAQLSTVELTPKQGMSQRYIIAYCPNAATYRHLLPVFQTLADTNQATVVCFDYPNVGNSKGSASSQSDLLNAGMAQVERLLKKGIAPENITLYGHSLGGAIATLVAAQCHEKQQRVSVINDRSFSSVGDVAFGFLPISRFKALLKGSINGLAWLINWNLNAGKAYRKIPAQYKMLIASKKDEVIHYKAASVYQKEKVFIQGKKKNVTKPIVYNYLAHKMYKMQDIHADYTLALLDALKENPEAGKIYLSKEGRYTICDTHEGSLKIFTGNLLDNPNSLTDADRLLLRSKLEKLENHLKDPVLLKLILNITSQKSHTNYAFQHGMPITELTDKENVPLLEHIRQFIIKP